MSFTLVTEEEARRLEIPASDFMPFVRKLVEMGCLVFPCAAKSKKPATQHGHKDAIDDLVELEEIWKQNPRANPAIACGDSGITVLDCDAGCRSYDEFEVWRVMNDLPETVTVRTGKRMDPADPMKPVWRFQMYFAGSCNLNGKKWNLDGLRGEIKSEGGYVIAPGGVHPDSGLAYYLIYKDATLAPVPLELLNRITEKQPTPPGAAVGPNRKIPRGEWHPELVRCAGRLVNAGIRDEEAIYQALLQFIKDNCEDPDNPDESKVRQIAHSAATTFNQREERHAYIGTPPAQEQQASRPGAVPLWHTVEEYENAPPIKFVVSGFHQDDGANGLAGLPGHGKTLLALSLVKSMLSGEPLFGYEAFNVNRISKKVIYLIPEVALTPFAHRLRLFGLLKYVANGTLLTQTLSHRDPIRDLSDKRLIESIEGADLFLDTAIRFSKGDNNSASDQREFSELVFNLLGAGCKSSVVLLHSTKSVKGIEDVKADKMINGTVEFHAMLSTAWGLYQEEMHENVVYVENIKPRDFEPCLPFRIQGRPYIDVEGNFRMASNPGAPSPVPDKKRQEQSDLYVRANDMLSKGKSVQEVALTLGVSDATVYRWIKQGYCPSFTAKNTAKKVRPN